MTTLMTIQLQYPSLDDTRSAHQARANPEAFVCLRFTQDASRRPRKSFCCKIKL
jgi:hypothetical protein